MLVALTIERFVAVCHSAWARKHNSSRRANKACICIPVTCLLLYLPMIFKSTLTTCTKDNDQIIYQKRDNHIYEGWVLFSAYKCFIETLFRGLPMLIIVSLNIIIIYKYRKLCQRRRELTLKNKNTKYFSEERRLVFLLGGISSMFFWFVTPVSIISLFHNEAQHFSVPFQLFRACSNILEVSNYSITFYMYFLFSREFRETFLGFFRTPHDSLQVGAQKSVHSIQDRQSMELKNLVNIVSLQPTIQFKTKKDFNK